VIAAISLLAIAVVAVQTLSPNDEAIAVVSPTSIDITAVAEVTAGESIDVLVEAPVADRTDVSLGVFSALESTHLEAVAANGVARFGLESQLLDHEGRVTLVAQIGATRTVHDLIVRAGPVVDPVVPLVGPRTIVADGQDSTMIVVSPTDGFGNPLPDGTQVTTQIVRADGGIETLTSVVVGGLAASTLTADTTAGRVTITSQVDGRDGPANVVDQVAGRPVVFTVATRGTNDSATQLFADGFTLVEVATSELRDPFGNLLPDGIVTTFRIESPDGVSFAPATVQNGSAATTIESPDRPGAIVVSASTSGTTSTPLTLDFQPAVQSLPVTSRTAVDGTPVVQLGPVITVRGGYPADGTAVTITNTRSGVTVTDALSRGVASVPLRAAKPGDVVRIEVLGAQTEITLRAQS